MLEDPYGAMGYVSKIRFLALERKSHGSEGVLLAILGCRAIVQRILKKPSAAWGYGQNIRCRASQRMVRSKKPR